MSLEEIDLSIGWAIMSAVEVLGASIAGVVLFHEPLTKTKIIGITITVVGVAMLSLTGGGGDYGGWRPWPKSWDTPMLIIGKYEKSSDPADLDHTSDEGSFDEDVSE